MVIEMKTIITLDYSRISEDEVMKEVLDFSKKLPFGVVFILEKGS